jgi:hypothetical protein
MLGHLFQLRPRLPGVPALLKLRLGLIHSRHARDRTVDGQRDRNHPNFLWAAAGLVDKCSIKCMKGGTMFDRSTIRGHLPRFWLALNRTLVATQRECDQAIQEREQAVAERKAVEGGKFPAALIAAEAERGAFRTQRDQAYGEIDGLCREHNELKCQLERLKRPVR